MSDGEVNGTSHSSRAGYHDVVEQDTTTAVGGYHDDGSRAGYHDDGNRVGRTSDGVEQDTTT